MMLLAIPGDNTYSNYQEATRSFWRQTVLPLVNRTAKALSTWLSPAWGAPLELRPDLDAIEALSPEREALWTRIDKATFLTPNEKRSAVGYGPLDEDPAQKFNPHHDERGRFTFGPNPDAAQPAQARRRAGRGEGTPAQQARAAVAAARARESTRRLQELEPTWQPPQSFRNNPPGIEGRIAEQEAIAKAAEARLAEILQNAIPDTNPSWGFNRLRKELNDQGYIFKEPTDSPGFLYVNPRTGEEVRIMERPSSGPSRIEPLQKFYNDFYYRYRPRDDQRWGGPITIPNK